jgi:competence protein ComEC
MNKIHIIAVGLFLFALLGVRFWFFFSRLPSYLEGQEVHLVSSLAEEPEITAGKQVFSLKDDTGVRIKVITGISPLLHYGQRLLISGKIHVSEYKGRTLYSLSFPTIVISSAPEFPLAAGAHWLRARASALYESALPPLGASLLLGIVFGGKQGMGETFVEDLRSTGVMHVVAASGMNVTFVAGALIGILGTFLRRKFALVAGIAGVIFYAYLAGFEASILRASIMAILGFGASLFGRQYWAAFSLFLTVFVLLFYSPILIYDIGFWLSFLSTGGILFIQPVLGWGKRWYLADLATTLSAQIATLPVMLGVFGQYGVLSLVVNGLVLWMIPFLMTCGALGLFVGLLFPGLGKVFLFLCLPFLWLFEWVVRFFGDLGWLWSIPEVGWPVWLGYYLLLGGAILFVHASKRQAVPEEVVLSSEKLSV